MKYTLKNKILKNIFFFSLRHTNEPKNITKFTWFSLYTSLVNNLIWHPDIIKFIDMCIIYHTFDIYYTNGKHYDDETFVYHRAATKPRPPSLDWQHLAPQTWPVTHLYETRWPPEMHCGIPRLDWWSDFYSSLFLLSVNLLIRQR